MPDTIPALFILGNTNHPVLHLYYLHFPDEGTEEVKG